MLSYDELLLTDGTTTIDLLARHSATGVHLQSWQPASSTYKDGGSWHNSPIADGQRPSLHAWDMRAEQMTFDVAGWDADDLADRAATLRNLLHSAWTYFEARLPHADPVYLIRRAKGESNRSYSVVFGGEMPRDGDAALQALPFHTVGYADWPVTIWREEHWRDTVPGEQGACVENAGYGLGINYLEFEADDEVYVDCGSDAALDNLTATTITVECWFRMVEQGEGYDEQWLIDKLDTPADGWVLAYRPADGFFFLVGHANTSAAAYTGSAVGSAAIDGVWHHLAGTWNNTWNHPRIWLDGVDQTNNTLVKIGARRSDAAASLLIGRRDSDVSPRYYDGDMGWTRVSDSVRYAAAFDVPLRCFLPAVDGNTVGQWIGGEDWGPTIDNQESTAALDGTLHGPTASDGYVRGTWGCDCLFGNIDPATGAVEYDCTDDYPVYVRNAQVRAHLTHIFYYDASGLSFSGNLVDESAYDLLPAAPAVDDTVYFGIDEDAHFYGPFHNLIFDLASAGIYTGVWEYYDSTLANWTPLVTYCDETDGLQETGVHAITWAADPDWLPAGVNGVTAYWIRFRITSVTDATPPTQQNRRVYTATWAFTEFQQEDVRSDVPPLAQYYGIHAAETDSGTCGNPFQADRVILSLRSLARGTDFVPYLNVGNHPLVAGHSGQPPHNVNCEALDGVLVEDERQANGLYLSCNDPVPFDTFSAFQRWEFYPWDGSGAQWYGEYRLFARAYCPYDYGTSRLRFRIYTPGNERYTKEHTFTTDADEVLLDFGRIALPGYEPLTDDDTLHEYMRLEAECAFSSASDRIRLYDICLMPADEKLVEVRVVRPADTYAEPWAQAAPRLDADSTMSLRTPARVFLREDDEGIDAQWLPVSSGPLWFQANADQRAWMLTAYWSTVYSTWISHHEFLTRMRLRRVARFRSLRGSR